MAKVEHFEIPADDVERAQTFYGEVFGFTFQAWDADNIMIGAPDGGIGGDIHKRAGLPHPTVVITVDNLEDTLAEVIAHGGEQVGPIEDLDEKSRYAYFRDSEGNIVGVYDSRD